MDFIIGLIIGLFFGGWIGLAVASLIAISRDKEFEAEVEEDPDGSKAVMKEAIATLKEKKRYLESKESEEENEDLGHNSL